VPPVYHTHPRYSPYSPHFLTHLPACPSFDFSVPCRACAKVFLGSSCLSHSVSVSLSASFIFKWVFWICVLKCGYCLLFRIFTVSGTTLS
jgi:hypothetical protein